MNRIHRALAGAIVVALIALTAPAVSAAGVRVLYVDGKRGSDSNAGTSLAAAFKTVNKAMAEVYREGVGRVADRVEIVGYADYTYYEKASASHYLPGTSTNPIVIQAYGFSTSASYVRPIISGAIVVSRPGSTIWSRPDATRYPDVWATPWTTTIPGYSSSVFSLRQERLYMDTNQPLVRPKPTPTLADLQATPASQWWDGKKLYVRLGLWSGSLASTDPRQHTIEIPNYKGLLIGTGSSYVTVRGLDIRHTNMAVGITGDAHHVTVERVDASYNYGMGFWTGSHHNTFRYVTGSRNTIQLIKLDDGAQYNLIEHVTGTENLGQGVKLSGSSNGWNIIRSSTFSGGKNVPMVHGQYGGYIQGILIEDGAHDNTIQSNTLRDNRRGIQLYQTSSAGKALNGNLIKYNLLSGNSHGVNVIDSRSGGNSTGRVSFYANTYAGNTYAVYVDGATSNKSFNHETFFSSSPASGLGAIYLRGSGATVTVTNSIVSGSTAYGFRADTGSKVTVTYTTVHATASGSRSGAVTWGTGNRTQDPEFLSTASTSTDYLRIDASSPVYAAGSAKDPLGARWR